MKAQFMVVVLVAALLALLSTVARASTTAAVAFATFEVTVTNTADNPTHEVWVMQPTNAANVFVTCFGGNLLVRPTPTGAGFRVPGYTNVAASTWYGVTLSNVLRFAYPERGYFLVQLTNPAPYSVTFRVTCN